MKNHSAVKRTALCGILAAASVALLFLGSYTVLDLSVVFICALITAVVVVETGNVYSWIFAGVCTALAFLLLPSKLYAFEYMFLGAAYPIIKSICERHLRLPAPVLLVIKVAVLDLMRLACLLLAKYVFTAGEDYYPLGILTMAAGTLVFALFDYVMSRCITLYILKIRPKLKFLG